MDDLALRQNNDHIPPLMYWYPGSFPSDRAPNLPNDTFAIVNTENTEPSYRSGHHYSTGQ